jgi:hypothetical protein
MKKPCLCARCRGVATANPRWGYDEAAVPTTECLTCGDPIGQEPYTLDTVFARFGQMFVRHARCAVFAALALVPALIGCVQQRPHTAQPMAFRHCVVTRELPGFVGCDCLNPLVVWDAQTKRKVVYCDGKIQL